jgi:hypothetical protein
VKFHSSQTRAGQFTAESATPNEDHHEGTKLIKLTVYFVNNNIFSFFVFLANSHFSCGNSDFSEARELSLRFGRLSGWSACFRTF